MRRYSDEAIVLRTSPLGEADSVITLLTRGNGRVRAVAKGVRRTRSRFGARLEPASHVDVMFHRGRSLDIVTQVEILSPYGSTLACDYSRYTAAAAVLETAEQVGAAEDQPSARLFLLVVGALRQLRDRQVAPPLVVDAFLLRAAAAAGWAPVLDDCARCGAPEADGGFSVPSGGVLCAGCRVPGTTSPGRAVPSHLSALLTGNYAAASADPAVRRAGSGLVAAHLQWHLERGLRSLAMVEGR